MVVEIAFLLLSFNAVLVLIPVIIILILIAAAAGLTRGTDIFAVFGVASMLGIAGGMGRGGKGKGLKAVRYGANPVIRGRAARSMARLAKIKGSKTKTNNFIGAAKALRRNLKVRGFSRRPSRLARNVAGNAKLRGAVERLASEKEKQLGPRLVLGGAGGVMVGGAAAGAGINNRVHLAVAGSGKSKGDKANPEKERQKKVKLGKRLTPLSEQYLTAEKLGPLEPKGSGGSGGGRATKFIETKGSYIHIGHTRKIISKITNKPIIGNENPVSIIKIPHHIFMFSASHREAYSDAKAAAKRKSAADYESSKDYRRNADKYELKKIMDENKTEINLAMITAGMGFLEKRRFLKNLPEPNPPKDVDGVSSGAGADKTTGLAPLSSNSNVPANGGEDLRSRNVPKPMSQKSPSEEAIAAQNYSYLNEKSNAGSETPSLENLGGGSSSSRAEGGNSSGGGSSSRSGYSQGSGNSNAGSQAFANSSSPYAILGLPEGSSFEDAKKAFRKLTLQYHPDLFKDEMQKQINEQKMKLINSAMDSIEEKYNKK
ncbi:MAG: J domain-containing protein [Candidatus Marsarchaeota archaeon]|nr:J domain-containing protein [Candidatus Marsarchaeota archaeon]